MDRAYASLEENLRRLLLDPEVQAHANEDAVSPEVDEGIAASHPPRVSLRIFAAPATADELNTIRPMLTVVACFRLNDARFEFDSSFIRPAARRELAMLGRLVKEHPDCPLSIFGHADPTGTDDYNKQLSGRRAQAMFALLTRNVALWNDLHDHPLGGDDWRSGSTPTMRAALVEAGQTAPAGRSDLFAAYMDLLCTDSETGSVLKLDPSAFLGGGAAGGKAAFQGCSEFNPVLVMSKPELASSGEQQRDAENGPNRRLVVFLFDPGSRVDPSAWPCPTVKEGTAGCRRRFWSDGDRRRSPGDIRRRFEDTEDTFACRFYHRMARESPCEFAVTPKDEQAHISLELRSNSGAVPLANLPYRIELANGVTLQGTTDGDGYCHHEPVPPGDYPLEIGGVRIEIPTLPRHITRRVTRVDGFLLAGDDTGLDTPVDDGAADEADSGLDTPVDDGAVDEAVLPDDA